MASRIPSFVNQGHSRWRRCRARPRVTILVVKPLAGGAAHRVHRDLRVGAPSRPARSSPTSRRRPRIARRRARRPAPRPGGSAGNDADPRSPCPRRRRGGVEPAAAAPEPRLLKPSLQMITASDKCNRSSSCDRSGPCVDLSQPTVAVALGRAGARGRPTRRPGFLGAPRAASKSRARSMDRRAIRLDGRACRRPRWPARRVSEARGFPGSWRIKHKCPAPRTRPLSLAVIVLAAFASLRRPSGSSPSPTGAAIGRLVTRSWPAVSTVS